MEGAMGTIIVTTLGPRSVSRWSVMKHRIGEWQRRARSRQQFVGLGDGSLRDLGLSRSDATMEGSKRFWLP
jgi:uncharacterized protein YjiS (DUF1127 family)